MSNLQPYTDLTFRVFELVIKPDPDLVDPYIIAWSNGERITDARISVPCAQDRRVVISWTNQLGMDIVLEFFGQTWDRSRSLKLFSHNADIVPVRNGGTTDMVVQAFADVKGTRHYPDGVTWENEHVYRVKDAALNQPGPGIIVCPPGQNPPCH